MTKRNINKILVITSGGDSPGMNAAIRGVVRTAQHYGIECYGSKLGYQGILDNAIFKIDSEFVANIIQRGGTILQSARFPEFKEPTVRAKAGKILAQHGIDALVVLGGDGSFRGASLLSQEQNLQVIGIPCTIDNDIVGTEYTIGFDTARNTALEAIDRIRDTAFSHNRHFLVEVMGKDTGFLAVDVGIAGGAEFILIPEFPIETSELIVQIKKRKTTKMGSIIVVAEGTKPGRSFAIADEIREKLGVDYPVCILGHTQRGGTPSVMDRKNASLMGAKAVTALRDGENNKMLAIEQGKMVLADFPDPGQKARHFTERDLMDINAVLCNV